MKAGQLQLHDFGLFDKATLIMKEKDPPSVSAFCQDWPSYRVKGSIVGTACCEGILSQPSTLHYERII